jgi:hypothetical protein
MRAPSQPRRLLRRQHLATHEIDRLCFNMILAGSAVSIVASDNAVPIAERGVPVCS